MKEELDKIQQSISKIKIDDIDPETAKKLEEKSRLDARAKRHPEYAKKCGVGKRHQSCTFSNYDGKEADELRAILKTGLTENVLIQSENTGNGKTHLAVSVLKAYACTDINEHKFVNFSNLMMEIRHTFNSDKKNENDVIAEYCKYKLLVIDDVGAEKASDYSTQVLYIILNNRYEAIKPTIITTNNSGEEIEHIYDKRIISRMRSGHLIKLDSKDRRGVK